MKIIQIVEGFKKGDGVGNVVSAIAEFFDRHGIENIIFKRTLVEADLSSDAFSNDDIVLYHLAVTLDPLVKDIPCKKILVFHNITKPELLGTFDEETRILCSSGWYDLNKTKDIFSYAIAFSDYSKKCLIEYGWNKDKIDVLPIQIRLDKLNENPDEKVIEKYRDGKTNVIFTGRVYPNKKDEDIIASFAFYHHNYNNNSRLILVGNTASGDYYPSLKEYAKQLGVYEAVIFTGRVSLQEYVGYFKVADVFLCMSEHEGFCIPLVEAMCFDVPIVAYNATAVPDTLGGAGVMVDQKAPETVAQAINELITKEDYRHDIISGQRHRLAEISGTTLEKDYERCLVGIIEKVKGEEKAAGEIGNKFRRKDTLSIGSAQERTYPIVIYGAGAAGSRLYVRMRNTFELVNICDNNRAGEFDPDLNCKIISPKEAVSEYGDAKFIISLQNRRLAFDITCELMDAGIDRNKIYFYDKMRDQVL